MRKVRILGETLTLYRDLSGKLGLIAERCPHRATSLHIGIPEKEGLRCCYHGWMFNENGRCMEMPLEPANSPFKDNIKITSYPVQELGGLIWAYLGPSAAPASTLGSVHPAFRVSPDCRSSAAMQLAAGDGESQRPRTRRLSARHCSSRPSPTRADCRMIRRRMHPGENGGSGASKRNAARAGPISFSHSQGGTSGRK